MGSGHLYLGHYEIFHQITNYLFHYKGNRVDREWKVGLQLGREEKFSVPSPLYETLAMLSAEGSGVRLYIESFLSPGFQGNYTCSDWLWRGW